MTNNIPIEIQSKTKAPTLRSFAVFTEQLDSPDMQQIGSTRALGNQLPLGQLKESLPHAPRPVEEIGAPKGSTVVSGSAGQ